jgi:hypothetical protein
MGIASWYSVAVVLKSLRHFTHMPVAEQGCLEGSGSLQKFLEVWLLLSFLPSAGIFSVSLCGLSSGEVGLFT